MKWELKDLRKRISHGATCLEYSKWPREVKESGRHLTLLSEERLDNLYNCCVDVITKNVPGDFIETGVWRGGACIYMRAIIEDMGSDKSVWCADSFQGLPPPSIDVYPPDAASTYWQSDFLKSSLEEVKSNFAGFDLLDDKVKFLKGWFKDTLPSAPIQALSVLRLDGDMYESTMDALNHLYDKVSVGGYIIVDDYGLRDKTCMYATEDFRTRRGITSPLIPIDAEGKYWQKEA